eukprot:g17782.t1
MRELDRDQKLIFAICSDAEDSIRCHIKAKSNPRNWQLKATHVLDWVMTNTANATLRGLPMFAYQGQYFASTKPLPPHYARLPENFELSMYEDLAVHQVAIATIAEETAAWFTRRMKENDLLASFTASKQLVEKISDHTKHFGTDIFVSRQAIGADSQCEREQEREQEREMEQEVELPKMKPCSEKVWQYSRALDCTSASQLSGMSPSLGVDIKPFHQFIQRLDVQGISDIDWFPDSLFCTSNFFDTVIQQHSVTQDIKDYLRLADAVLAFPDASLLLLSDFEAEQILALYQDGHKDLLDRRLPAFVNLAFISHCVDNKLPITHAIGVFPGVFQNREGTFSLCSMLVCESFPSLLTAVEVYNGRVNFPKEKPPVQNLIQRVDSSQGVCLDSAVGCRL